MILTGQKDNARLQYEKFPAFVHAKERGLGFKFTTLQHTHIVLFAKQLNYTGGSGPADIDTLVNCDLHLIKNQIT